MSPENAGNFGGEDRGNPSQGYPGPWQAFLGALKRRDLASWAFRILLVTAVGGLSGILAYLAVGGFLQLINERDMIISPTYFLVLGLLVGLVFSLAEVATVFTQRSGKNEEPRSFYSPTLVTAGGILALVLGLNYLGDNGIIAWFSVSLLYGLSIYIGTGLISRSRNYPALPFRRIFGAGIGGLSGGLLVSSVALLRTISSVDEGYAILMAFSMAVSGAVLGLGITGSIWIVGKLRAVDSPTIPKPASRRKLVVSILLVAIIMTPVTINSYWASLDLNTDAAFFSGGSQSVFLCSQLNEGEGSTDSVNVGVSEVIAFLERLPNKKAPEFATLFLLSGDPLYGQKFRQALLDEVGSNEFIALSGSDKAWQYHAMLRGYYYLQVEMDFPQLFDATERNRILDWFRAINENALRLTWVDLVYGLSFKETPTGIYANQEIGVGLLSVLAEVLKDRYPDVSRENLEYVRAHAIGWSGNFRNPDDGVVYHQAVWMKNAYVLGRYGNIGDLRGINSLRAFEWVLLQWPPNGMSPAYNMPFEYTPIDVMVIGSRLFGDGRYLWLAQRMLEAEMRLSIDERDPVMGLEYWDEGLEPQRPQVGSCYLTGTTGIAQRPGPARPDKLVFRDGWEPDSLYALLNLRFSGWHRYKATNSFVTIMYGEPFVVEDLDIRHHPWLPDARADHRDRRVDRDSLNGLLIEADGLERIVAKLTGTTSGWYQDPPRFAELVFFNYTSSVDFSKTRISDWHGWTHERVSVLVKDGYFVVLDNARGRNSQKVSLDWHLKGDAETFADGIRLSQGDYSLAVHFPRLASEYRAVTVPDTKAYPPAGHIHDSDLTLSLVSENVLESGFVTLFLPLTDSDPYEVERVRVLDDQGKDAYPRALAVRLTRLNQTDVIGTRFEVGRFVYGDVTTDSEAFVQRTSPASSSISFNGATFFEIRNTEPPAMISLNGRLLENGRDWSHANGATLIFLDLEAGILEILFQA